MPQPIILSTWSFGMAANRAAWPNLSVGGPALDAVEAAARVPELPWMVMLGWQILIMMQLESDAATVATTSS